MSTKFMTSQVVQPTETCGMLGMAQPIKAYSLKKFMHAAIVAGASKIPWIRQFLFQV